MTNDLIYDSNSLDKKVVELISTYDIEKVQPELEKVGIGQIMEVENRTGQPNLYYQWLACLIKLIKPKQVVELGAAAGVSTLLMAREMPEDSKLYSVDIDPQAWRWMSKDYPQVVKILGDDLNMAIWPGSVDLMKTDIWFIDSLHTEEQLRGEIELYKPYWKRGTIVVLDDIRMPGLNTVWNELSYDKCETTNPNHYSGFGHFIV
jgi:predicted O-methyltransferase YrrM